MKLIIAENNMERDKFLSPTEAKQFGIIDKVLEHPLQEKDRLSENNTTVATQV